MLGANFLPVIPWRLSSPAPAFQFERDQNFSQAWSSRRCLAIYVRIYDCILVFALSFELYKIYRDSQRTSDVFLQLMVFFKVPNLI